MFFFKQKTAYEMRSSDWSSDVCSSDLPDRAKRIGRRPVSRHLHALLQPDAVEVSPAQMSEMARRAVHDTLVDRGDPRTAAAARQPAQLCRNLRQSGGVDGRAFLFLSLRIGYGDGRRNPRGASRG